MKKGHYTQCIICGNINQLDDKLPDNMDLVCDDCRNTIFYMKNYMAMMKFKATWRKEDENI